ncbi:MAG: hypothetical protein K6B72_13340 [Lachnospiraceae bacterium]|nr:hypothetical protein [Lachnospiraceae bacterium]
MAINRVDVTGTFIRQDLSHVRQEEMDRTSADMNRLSNQVEQKAQLNHESVTEPQTFEPRDEKFDASEEGKNKYYSDKKKREKKKTEELKQDPKGVIVGANGKPLYGAKRSAFDLKI